MSHFSERHAALAANFTRLAEGVTDWDAPTPVKEWAARDIVSHFTSWVPGFLGSMGVAFDELPTKTDDPVAEWKHMAATMQDFLEDPERCAQVITHPLTQQEAPIEQLLSDFHMADILMHSWDLAKSSGQDPQLDPDETAGLVHGMTQMKDALAASGQFGVPVVLDDTHPMVDRLAAIIGRDPHWTPEVGRAAS